MLVVLVEFVGRVGEFLGQFLSRLAVADVVVAVTVAVCSQCAPVSSFLPL